jgi:hypothetical protein
VKGTRIISNQLGYLMHHESSGFAANQVITVADDGTSVVQE